MRGRFYRFDYFKVAGYGEDDVQRILVTEVTIRSERKIGAMISIARAFSDIVSEYGTFSSSDLSCVLKTDLGILGLKRKKSNKVKIN